MHRAAVLYNESIRIVGIHGRERPWLKPLHRKARQSAVLVFRRCRSYPSRRNRVRAQLAELSSRGCYIDALEPIPVRTKLRLRICDGMSTCELHGKVLYMHSGGGFGIFGMGVLFEEMGAEEHSAIGAWLRKLAGRSGNDSGKNSFSQSEDKSH